MTGWSVFVLVLLLLWLAWRGQLGAAPCHATCADKPRGGTGACWCETRWLKLVLSLPRMQATCMRSVGVLNHSPVCELVPVWYARCVCFRWLDAVMPNHVTGLGGDDCIVCAAAGVVDAVDVNDFDPAPAPPPAPAPSPSPPCLGVGVRWRTRLLPDGALSTGLCSVAGTVWNTGAVL